jgi:hypothetical protein
MTVNTLKDYSLTTTHRKKGPLTGVTDDKKLLLTLSRSSEFEPWGFSAIGAKDIFEQGGFWSGVNTRRHEKGVWFSVQMVRDETPSSEAGLKPHDLITRINGRIVFHLEAEDIQRLISHSGKTLYLDIERNLTKSWLYNRGMHQYSFNFLCKDIHADM